MITLAALGLIGAAYMMAYVSGWFPRRPRWEMPGVFAPESCFTPARFRELCHPVFWDRQICAPESSFTPERLNELRHPGYWDRRVCAPEACFTPERLRELKEPIYWHRELCAPESAFTPERLADLTGAFPWRDGPDVYCPDGRDLWWDAMQNIVSMAPKRSPEEEKAGRDALAEFEQGATP